MRGEVVNVRNRLKWMEPEEEHSTFMSKKPAGVRGEKMWKSFFGNGNNASCMAAFFRLLQCAIIFGRRWDWGLGEEEGAEKQADLQEALIREALQFQPAKITRKKMLLIRHEGGSQKERKRKSEEDT